MTVYKHHFIPSFKLNIMSDKDYAEYFLAMSGLTEETNTGNEKLEYLMETLDLSYHGTLSREGVSLQLTYPNENEKEIEKLAPKLFEQRTYSETLFLQMKEQYLEEIEDTEFQLEINRYFKSFSNHYRYPQLPLDKSLLLTTSEGVKSKFHKLQAISKDIYKMKETTLAYPSPKISQIKVSNIGSENDYQLFIYETSHYLPLTYLDYTRYLASSIIPAPIYLRRRYIEEKYLLFVYTPASVRESNVIKILKECFAKQHNRKITLYGMDVLFVSN